MSYYGYQDPTQLNGPVVTKKHKIKPDKGASLLITGKPKGKGGSSCHQCKSRRNFNALTYCTSNLDKKNKKCRKKFCGHCLKKFYKETVQDIADKGNWRCPSCRKICCCAACRRRKLKDLENGSGDGTAPPAPPPKPKKTKTYNSSSSSSSSPSSSSSSSCIYNHNKPHAHAHLHLHDDDFNNSPSIQEQTPSFHDVNVPPVPTVMMPTSGLSSPMTTPMQSPANAANFEFLGANDLHLKDDGLTSQAQWSESYSASLPHVPSDQYPQLLQDQIRKQAKAASVDKANSQFARLYKMAQTPKISKKIQAILAKKDMQQVEKVEAIASLLRVHVAR